MTFLNPEILWFLLAIPPFYWLLRHLPPKLRERAFPGMVLLKNIPTAPPAKTPPWWLLLLRLLVLIGLIFALAAPVCLPKEGQTPEENVLIWLDNSWPAAQNWASIRTTLHKTLEEAQSRKQNVFILPTAAPTPKKVLFKPAEQWLEFAQNVAPKPWSSEDGQITLLQDFTHISPLDTKFIWLSSGLLSHPAEDIKKILVGFKNTTIYGPQKEHFPVVITQSTPQVGGIQATVKRFWATQPSTYTLNLNQLNGFPLTKVNATFTPGALTTQATLKPSTSTKEIGLLTLKNQQHLGALLAVPNASGTPKVGIIENENGDFPLLQGRYYVQKALEGTYSTTHIATEQEQNTYQDYDVLFLLSQPTALKELEAWAQKGGVLITFAGPWLQENKAIEPLLPSALRTQPRVLAGPLSWTGALSIKSTFPQSPLYPQLKEALTAEAVKVKKQFLPAAFLAENSVWVALEDGTPLISGVQAGAGWKVFIHTSAVPDWSDLPASGFFAKSLKALVSLGASTKATLQSPVFPLRYTYAFTEKGLLAPPQKETYLPTQNTPINRAAPPGIYAQNVLHQLEGAERTPTPLEEDVFNTPIKTYGTPNQNQPYTPLAPLCWLVVLGAFLVDSAYQAWRNQKIWAIFFIFSVSAYTPAALGQTPLLPEAAYELQLGWIDTHHPTLNALTARGLESLSLILKSRTTLTPTTPKMLNLEKDELGLYPIIFWPIAPDQPRLTPNEQLALLSYVSKGGFLVIDAATDLGDGQKALKQILRADLPFPLKPLPEEHVLQRSYYLLRNHMPGRQIDQVWIETTDRLGRILIGNHDWIGAWALDESGAPLRTVPGGGASQRLAAFRFGINLVMYALLGDYKLDQIHIQKTLDNLTPEESPTNGR